MGNESKRISCIVIEDNVLAVEMMEDYIGRRDDLELLGIGHELSDVKFLVEKHNPSIIFLDLVIPPGESKGYHIGKLPATSTVIVISGVPLSEYRGILPEGKIYELPKPISFRSFDTCVNEVLDMRMNYRYGTSI
ncbi:hypothetical protein [Sphingobacterium faecium]|uniref:hypothetical protein n=1 Tax=Sphingobacterium faecium TaxID=34087 RepID=UPI00320A7CE2